MKLYDKLDTKLRKFIADQHMFFVASAPREDDGHVNMSPKGLDETFKIIDDTTIAYLDIGGSGIETQAHLQQNGRLTIMFCAFQGKANILRLFGRGKAIDFDHPDFAKWRAEFDYVGNSRAVIVLNITRIQDSCGWGVPFYAFQGQREQLKRASDRLPEDEWKTYRRNRNAESIDGLPGMSDPSEFFAK